MRKCELVMESFGGGDDDDDDDDDDVDAIVYTESAFGRFEGWRFG